MAVQLNVQEDVVVERLPIENAVTILECRVVAIDCVHNNTKDLLVRTVQNLIFNPSTSHLGVQKGDEGRIFFPSSFIGAKTPPLGSSNFRGIFIPRRLEKLR